MIQPTGTGVLPSSSLSSSWSPPPSSPAATRADRVRAAVDGLIVLLLAVLLAFLPLALGAVEAWSEWVAILLGAAIALLLALRQLFSRRSAPSRRHAALAYVPMAIFVGLAALQLVSLPTSLVRLISPETARMKTQLLEDLPMASDPHQATTLSFYPAATRHDLRLVLLASVVFMAVLAVCRSPARIRWMLAIITLIGAGLSALAIAQVLTNASGIYWRIPVRANWWTGTFVNHSDFGQHINLCIGAAIGFLLVTINTRTSARRQTLPHRVARWLTILGLAGVVVAGIVALLLSRTRGGIVAAAIASLLVLVIMAMRQGLKTLLGFGVLAGAVAVVFMFVFGFGALTERVATLAESNIYADRLTTVADLWGICKGFPLVGTGLGTHEVVYPRFDHTGSIGRSTHAENEYAEAAEETGAIGLGAVLLFATFVWWCWAKSIRRKQPPICSAAVGLGYGLLASQIHSLSAFGQHLPAIGCLSAATCALLINLAWIQDSTVSPVSSRRARRGSTGRIILATAGIAIAIWAVRGANTARCAEPYWNQAAAQAAVLRARRWKGTSAEYDDLVAAASAASREQPDNIRYRVWLDVYRWQSATQSLADPVDGPSDAASTASMVDAAQSIVADLNAARASCPTYGPLYTLLGQIEWFVLGRPIGAEHIRTAAVLSPHDSVACFAAGELDAREGRWEDAARNFAHVLTYGRGRTAEILRLYLVDLHRPDMALRLAVDDPHWQLALSASLTSGMAAAARHQAVRALEKGWARRELRPFEVAMLAALYAEDGNDGGAVLFYQRALMLDQSQVPWRFELASALTRLRRFNEAEIEASACLRVKPDFMAARQLLDTIHQSSSRD